MSSSKPLHTFASLAVILPAALIAQFSTSYAASGPLSAHQVAALTSGATHRYAVILKNQHTELSGGIHVAARSAAISTDERPLVAELNQVQAKDVYAYHVAAMVRGTFTEAEAAHLASNPVVRAVVPDKVVPFPKVPNSTETATSDALSTRLQRSRALHPFVNQVTNTGTSGCTDTSTTGTNPQLEPESLQLDHTAYQDMGGANSTPQAANLVDGTGVTVAILADAFDPTNPDIAPAVKSYVDFSGEGLSTPGEGVEAMLDASSIAAQGIQKYDVMAQVPSAVRTASTYMPTHCWVKVRGVAPGAKILYEKVFPNAAGQWSTVLAQAVDYAVLNGADVINESYGQNIYPDISQDPNALANDGAVAAGKVVDESVGDAGPESTISAGATDPNVIAAGGTTAERSSSQTGSPAIAPNPPTGNTGGFQSNNIASISSDGISEAGNKTVDLTAAADSAWIICGPFNPPASWIYGCGGLAGNPFGLPTNHGIVQSGGTSMSAPLLSGEAALVIEAYRNTHGGVTPSPLLVKEIEKSTATNLNAPSNEQGGGLSNTLAAVQAASAYPDDNGPTPNLSTLACDGKNNGAATCPNNMIYSTTANSPDQSTMLVAKGATNQTHHFQFTVTNASNAATGETVSASNQVLGSSTVNHYAVNFPTSSSGLPIKNSGGSTRKYQEIDFSVGTSQAASCDGGSVPTPNAYTPPGSSPPNHLTVSIAWPFQDFVAGNVFVRLLVYDPSWNFVGWSDPQGGPNYYGEQQVTDPVAGCWHAIVYINPGAYLTSGTGAFGFARQPFALATYQSTFGSTGSNSAPQLVNPGQTALFTAAIPALGSAGDESASVLLNNGSITTTIPVAIRSRVPENLGLVGSGLPVGTFTGDLLGGNGRGGAAGQVFTYEFNVSSSLHDLALRVRPSDTTASFNPPCNSDLEGELVDPTGNPVDLQSTYPNACDFLQFFRHDPMPGNWSFIMWINSLSAGTATDIPFTGSIYFNKAILTITPSGLPTSAATVLNPGTTIHPSISITNPSTSATEAFFADPRLTDKTQTVTLLPKSIGYKEGKGLPPPQVDAPSFFVPPATTQLNLHAESYSKPSTPLLSELVYENGAVPSGFASSPDIAGNSSLDSATGNQQTNTDILSPEIAPGYWQGLVFQRPNLSPNGINPMPNVLDTAAATTQAFDMGVKSSTGVPWKTGFTPLNLNIKGLAGDTGLIKFSLTPVQPKGTVVHGVIYVDTLTTFPGLTNPSIDETLAFPYTYTVG